MGLWDDFISGTSGFFDSAGQAASDLFSFDSTSSAPTDYSFLGDFGSQLVGAGASAIGTSGSGVPAYYQPTMAAAGPALTGIARAGGVVGRSFFMRFPNLATAIQGFRNAGMNVTRTKLYSLMKRFGPDFLIAGGILSAAAISELMMAGPGRRRMNPGNVKALRRAHRRMKSFHHVCQVNDTLLHHRRRPTKSRGFAGTSITQVK